MSAASVTHELRLADVRYRYAGADLDVFPPLSARLREGAWWLRGRNGAGKTTLLELIAGLRTPADGTIELDGAPAPRARVTYAPSTPAVFDELDAAEHAALVVELWELEREASELYLDRFETFVDDFHVPGSLRRAGDMSAGMREKLGLSLLLALDTDVVLLDEPFTASDAASLAVGQRILGDIARHRIVIVTSHLPAVVEPLAPTVLDLDAEASA